MLKLPPGKYYIGDPCYVFQDATWDRLLETALEDLQHGEITEFDGRQLWGHATMHGDGVFEDQNGVEYGVDTGTLGAVPIELIDDPAGEENGTIVDAPNGLSVEHDNGTFWFGNIVIKTNADLDKDFDDDEVDGGYDGDLNFDRL
jgi:hypothetical protein